MATNVFPNSCVNLLPNYDKGATSYPTIATDADSNLSKWVMQYSHASNMWASGVHLLGPNYLTGTSVTVRVRWRTSATSGNVGLILSYCQGGQYGSYPHVTGASTVIGAVTVAAPGTANQIAETVLVTGSDATLVPNSAFAFSIERSTADSCTGTVEILSYTVEYAVSPTAYQGYMFVPAQAFSLPSASNVTQVNIEADGSTYVVEIPVLSFPKTGTPQADFKFNLPSNFNGGLTWTPIWAPLDAATSSCGFHLDMAYSNVGASDSQTLTAQGTQTLANGYTPGPALIVSSGTPLACVVTPGAGSEVFCRLARDITDASTGAVGIAGILIGYNLISANPQPIRLDPCSGAQVTGSAAVLAVSQNPYLSQFNVQAPPSVNSWVDYVGQVPNVANSGGAVRVRWTTSVPGGNAEFRADYAYVAVGGASDPALTVGTPVITANLGAGVVNETLLAIPTGFGSSDMLNLRLWRLGGVSDTVAGTIDIIELVAEMNH